MIEITASVDLRGWDYIKIVGFLTLGVMESVNVEDDRLQEEAGIVAGITVR